MNRLQVFRSALVCGASVLALARPVAAKEFDIPDGDLSAALTAYVKQTNVEIFYADNDVRGHRSRGAKGDYTETAALNQLLQGTGFTTQTTSSNAIEIVQEKPKPAVQLAQAATKAALAPAQTGVETVVVTAQKKSEDIQQVPIAVSAFSQKDLTERQIAGGPDLVKEIPNLTFSKTNFSGYNLEIRGIGTQAISVTTDPAVAVAFNDIPFIRNHFFEQEFYDLADAEVLRGPQGTLYGRNATAGVVNIKSALPTDQYEAMMSADLGNYNNRRLEGMLNLPIVGDTLDIRFAGEWTKRDGYTEDTTLDTAVDGRDLWSGRVTIAWKPASDVQTEFVWEHFSEDDNRLRSGKQLCKTDYGPGTIGGYNVEPAPSFYGVIGDYLTQGCSSDVSLYSPQAFEAPLGYALPYVLGMSLLGEGTNLNPYSSVTQSTNLRQIESSILPHYIAKNDTLEYNADWKIDNALTFTSQTGYNHDFLWSTEDFNRFGSNPGVFVYSGGNSSLILPDPLTGTNGIPADSGVVCDPQLGCSDRLIVEDLSDEHAWQLSQEFRLSSNFSGPFNFTTGGNFLHYETEENYYVFSNALTRIAYNPSVIATSPYSYNQIGQLNITPTGGYIDPDPISSLNNEGHNYYLNQNPYVLNSYAVFGDANYDIANDLKFIAGLRWTDDQKHFLEIPSWVATSGYGYPITGVVDQSWERFTGRTVLNWTPQLDFTDQTLVYGSYAHGYKAGGANPPGAVFTAQFDGETQNPVHPLTFKPEYIEAFELGTKNTMLDGSLTVNADIFYYNYTGYQISEIVDRTAINTNYNAHVEGAELETNWEPTPGLKFGFTGGFENSGLAGGTEAVDLMDRTAGVPGWYVVKPFVTEASNCIFPTSFLVAALEAGNTVVAGPSIGPTSSSWCSLAYMDHLDPLTGYSYVPNPTVSRFGASTIPAGYPGFNPATAPNDGEGFSKDLSGNQLPNAPHITASLTAEYTMPVSEDWAATFHTDLYWQSQQWARVFDDPIDKIHGYSNVNLALTLTSANGWEVMAYVKNVFDVTAITGTFLNSDDTGLTTNVFLTDPRLFGMRVTKHLDQNDGFWGSDWSGYDFFNNLFSDTDNGKPSLWIELGGDFAQLNDAQQPFTAPFFPLVAKNLESPTPFEHPVHGSFDYDGAVTFQPDGSEWELMAQVRYGRAGRYNHMHEQEPLDPAPYKTFGLYITPSNVRYSDAFNSTNESHEIFDFMAGKDVGLGMLGLNGSSDILGGLRFVQFNQSSSFSIHSDPDYTFNRLGPKYDHQFSASDSSKRSFHGLGPALDWKASSPLSADSSDGGISVDWGSNFAVLFGRQLARVHHQTGGVYVCKPLLNGGCHVTGTAVHTNFGFEGVRTHYQRSGPAQMTRSRMVAVPNIGAFAGVSWKYQNAKVSFGYRADEFFGAMDGGIDTHRSENVGFFGPFANISIGIGG